MSSKSKELQTLLRKDLFAAYRDVTSRPCPSQQLAFMRTVRHPAPRYYIGTKKAAEVVGSLLRGETRLIERMSPLRRRMYIALKDEVLRLSQRREYQGASLKFIVSFAIAQPAAEFYITSETFRRIFRNAKRYGVEFEWKEAKKTSRQYTNYKDNTPREAVYKGKLLHILS